MASFFSNFLHGLAEGDTVKDYRHASNLFSHDNFRLAPKYRHLFHCNIILNKSLKDLEYRFEHHDKPQFLTENK